MTALKSTAAIALFALLVVVAPLPASAQDTYGNGTDSQGSSAAGIAMAELRTTGTAVNVSGVDASRAAAGCPAGQTVYDREFEYTDYIDVVSWEPVYAIDEETGESVQVGQTLVGDMSGVDTRFNNTTYEVITVDASGSDDHVRLTTPAGACREAECDSLKVESVDDSTGTDNLWYVTYDVVMSNQTTADPVTLPFEGGYDPWTGGGPPYSDFEDNPGYFGDGIPTVWYCRPTGPGVDACELASPPACYIANLGVFEESVAGSITNLDQLLDEARGLAEPADPVAVTSPDAGGLNWVKWAMWSWIETPEGVVAEAVNPFNTVRVRVFGMPADVEFDYGDGSEVLACRTNEYFSNYDEDGAPLMRAYESGVDPLEDPSDCSHEYEIATETGDFYTLTASTEYWFTYNIEYRPSASAPWPTGDTLAEVVAAAAAGQPTPDDPVVAFDADPPLDIEVNEIHSLVSRPN